MNVQEKVRQLLMNFGNATDNHAEYDEDIMEEPTMEEIADMVCNIAEKNKMFDVIRDYNDSKICFDIEGDYEAHEDFDGMIERNFSMLYKRTEIVLDSFRNWYRAIHIYQMV